MLTLLQIVNAAQAELGLPQSATVVGNTDFTTQQMLALANRTLDELRRCNPTGWTAMQFEYDLVVPVPATLVGDLLTAYTNTISNIPNTIGILSNYYTVSGPSLPQAVRAQSINTPISTVTLSMEATNPDPVVGASFVFSQDTFPEPPGFDWFQNRTMWDRTNRWELIGPDSPQTSQREQSGIVPTTPRRHFRQLGPYANNFRIWPPPVELKAPLQLVFEYMSLNAVSQRAGDAAPGSPSSAGQPNNPPTYGQYFTSDSDIPLLDDQSIIMGIKWMFWEIKGFGSYVTLQNRWVDYVDRMIARDGAAPTLQLNKRISAIYLTSSNVQDGNYPASSS